MTGLERKDVEISIDEDNILTLRAEKTIEEDKNVQHCERSYGVYYRLLQLPSGIDPSNVQATMSNGVLKISIPKPAKSEPKKIEIKESKEETKQAA
jgi:HSP20 family protein